MSNGRLILNFKNGVSLALDEEKIRDGAVIEIDSDFTPAGLHYEEAVWTPVSREESHSQTVMRLAGPSQPSAGKKRKVNPTQDTEDDKRIKSVVATAEGKLVSAMPAEVQEVRRATLTPTQRRNKNRRIAKMLRKLTADQHEETASSVRTDTPKKPVRREPEKRKPIPRTAERMKETDRKTEKEPKLRQHAEEPVPRNPVAKATPEDTQTEYTPEEPRYLGGRPGVEPYIPQYVTRPRPLQMISEYELEKLQQVKKKTFKYFERIDGREINILEGLELHTDVFSDYEQKLIVDCVEDLQRSGREGRLRKNTYSEPRRWMGGKGRVTIQCGCCYNFAKDRKGNPPGILRDADVDPLPGFIKFMIKRLVTWRVLPASCIPDSCIINIYEEGDCIPPHIDHHDFVRPFSTVSFINECNILFGSDLRIVGPGKFQGPVEIPLPVGSVLVLQGNGADVAKHSIPGVPCRRISVTFRRMNDSKMPYRFQPDEELENLKPYEL